MTSAPLGVVSEWPPGHGDEFGCFWGWVWLGSQGWVQGECWDRFHEVLDVGMGTGSPSTVQNLEFSPWNSEYPLDQTATAPHTALLILTRHKSSFSMPPQLPRAAETFPCQIILFSGSSPGPFPREMPTPPNTPRELHPKLPLFSVFSHSALTGGAG